MKDIIKTKKAQAAMEFLMTYGWAILVVLAAIAALAYFGVLSPTKFLPETCTLPPTSGISCLDFRVTPDSAVLMLVNGGGRDLILNNISIDICTVSSGATFPDGSSKVINFTGCSFGTKGGRIRADLILSYSQTDSLFTKSAEGTIITVIN